MKTRRIFLITALLSAVLFLFFIYYMDNNVTSEQQNIVNNHAKVISESLWTFNPDLAEDYLQLASKTNKYKKLIVRSTPNKRFISIEHELESPVDLFFESLSLIKIVPLESEIIHDGDLIGEISVEWCNTAVYSYLLLFIIISLVLTIFWYILSTVEHKNELEIRVSERTSEFESEIEERRKAENALLETLKFRDKILSDAPVGITIYNTESGQCVAANKAMAELIGAAEEQVLAQNFYNIESWKKSGMLDVANRAVRNNSKEQYECSITTTFGNNMALECHFGAFLAGDQKYLLLAVTDITERKRTAEQIEASLREKEILIGEIHHRVKNNMQLIISMLNLQLQYPDKIDAETLQNIINRVRIFGDIHRSLYQQEDVSKIDFNKHLKANLQNLIKAYNVENKDIELELNIENFIFSLDQAVSCGLLMNELISNSLKHAFSEKGKISISINHDADGELDKIVFYDNGKGMESSYEGFGTKIINALAEQLDMSVHISYKEGARFDFTRKGIDNTTQESGSEILYVEDEVLIAMEKTASLKKIGYSFNDKVITSGEEAVKYIKEASMNPALILMDIGLKGKMNGIEAAKEISKDNPSIPIIFLSSYEDHETQNKIAAIPGAAFLNKMSTIEEMKELIDKCLR